MKTARNLSCFNVLSPQPQTSSHCDGFECDYEAARAAALALRPAIRPKTAPDISPEPPG
jgi:hypothetical protein